MSSAALALLIPLLFGVAPATAQLCWTFYGRGEIDQNDMEFGLVGVTTEPRRMGWMPTAQLDISRLHHAVETDTANVWSAIPSLGLRYVFNAGSIAVRAGYVLTQDAFTIQPSVPADFGEGVVNAIEFQYRAARAIGSYNYGAENVWARASASHRMAQMGRGYIVVGGEAGYVKGAGVESIQPGMMLGWQQAQQFDFQFGIGRRLGDDDDTTYFRIELRYSPER